MVLYLTDENKTSMDGIFGIGCNPTYATLEMEFLQRIFFHDKLDHPYIQVIFAFDVGLNLPLNFLRTISIEIGFELISDRRQVFGAIHYLDKPEKIHCHYLINFVGIDGSLYRQRYSLWHYKTAVNKILIAYNLTPIKMYINDKFALHC